MSTTTFSYGSVVDEAVEVAGLDPAALTHTHLESVQRSLELLFIDLEMDGANAEFRTETRSWDIDEDVGGVVLDADVIDVLAASYVQDGKRYPLGRSTREDFQNLSFPTDQGAPAIYWINKAIRTSGNTETLPTGVTIPPAATGKPVLVLWPQNGIAGDIELVATVFRQHAMPTGFGDALDASRGLLPTICTGLAWLIARKYNPQNAPGLKAEYDDLKGRRVADEDRHPVVVGYRGFGWGRARRH